MYDYWYNVLKFTWGKNISLIYTDTGNVLSACIPYLRSLSRQAFFIFYHCIAVTIFVFLMCLDSFIYQVISNDYEREKKLIEGTFCNQSSLFKFKGMKAFSFV